MKVAEKAKVALELGLNEIKAQFDVPDAFPTEVLSIAESRIAARDESGQPLWGQQRRDATDIPFVTLDPATSTDLDQAFAIREEGNQLVLDYALADLSPFVPFDCVIEREAWKRGVTIYSLSEKVPLYPRSISQVAASLLPDGNRPAILVSVAVDPDGRIELRGIESVYCRSRAKLAYDRVDLSKIPFLEEFANRIWIDEEKRGAIRLEFPQQEIVEDPQAPGGVRLELRARLKSEVVNSSMSLAVNMAIGEFLNRHKVGLFRVMDEPTPRAMEQLRREAHALQIGWKGSETLRELQRRLDPSNAVHQRFLMEVRRAGGRASYALYQEGKRPWHAAIAGTYAHVTAPMRRLADRYVLDLAKTLYQQVAPSQPLLNRLSELPETMLRCEGRAANIDRCVIDLLEAVSLQHRIGDILEAEVIDAEAGIVQTIDSAIRSRAMKLDKVVNGQIVRVRIDAADPATRKVRLTAIS